MSTSSTPERPDLRDAYASFLHNTSLVMLFLAPALIALPPRKLDLYTLSLGGAFFASANQLTKERTGGRGLIAQFGPPPPPLRSLDNEGLEDGRRLLEETDTQDGGQRGVAATPMQGPGATIKQRERNSSSRAPSKLEQKAREVWMGGETEGWKDRRLREEQEKLAQGEGYGSMIMDQIWEVWNWGEKKGEVLKTKDEEVVAARKREESGRR